MDTWNKNRSLREDELEDDDHGKRREQDAKRKQELDAQLDQGLEDTFPGSDPVAVTQPPPGTRGKRRR